MNMRWDKLGARVLIGSGLLSAIERREGQQENLLRILAYHRIGDPSLDRKRGDPSLFSASGPAFEEQMRFLADHYHVVSPPEMLEALAGGKPLPPRSVMVTFDDAYHDFLELAWPVLARLQLPAVLFVPTDYMCGTGRIFWWDRLYQAFARTPCHELHLPPLGCWRWRNEQECERALKAVKRQLKHMNHSEAMAFVDRVVDALAVEVESEGLMLTWPEVRAMSDCGLYVGAHTASHPILSRVATDVARSEIARSQQRVAKEMGRSWPLFCYPVGHPPDLRPELVSVLKDEGFVAAVTMIEGHNTIGRSAALALRRVAIAPHLTLPEFRLVLTRAYDIYGLLAQIGPRDWK